MRSRGHRIVCRPSCCSSLPPFCSSLSFFFKRNGASRQIMGGRHVLGKRFPSIWNRVGLVLFLSTERMKFGPDRIPKINSREIETSSILPYRPYNWKNLSFKNYMLPFCRLLAPSSGSALRDTRVYEDLKRGEICLNCLLF